MIWMNEPARPDARAVFVAAGAALAVLAVAQVPRANRLPASMALAVCIAMISALFVHTHNYPGRMTIHLVPFTTALAVIAATRVFAAASNNRQPRVEIPTV
jgi:peptidoglycan/LPS O-acetylase OafA/YrhL